MSDKRILIFRKNINQMKKWAITMLIEMRVLLNRQLRKFRWLLMKMSNNTIKTCLIWYKKMINWKYKKIKWSKKVRIWDKKPSNCWCKSINWKMNTINWINSSWMKRQLIIYWSLIVIEKNRCSWISLFWKGICPLRCKFKICFSQMLALLIKLISRWVICGRMSLISSWSICSCRISWVDFK